MATIKGKLKTKTANGADVLYPETSADMVTGLSDSYVTKGTEQTITGNKTFIGQTLRAKATESTSNYFYVKPDGNGYNAKIGFQSDNLMLSNSYVYSMKHFIPNGSSYDLGISSNKWRDLYLSGSLKDGTNSITVAKIENTDNKVTSISSSSTDIQYPSAKAVYAAIEGAIQGVGNPMVFKGSLGTGGTITSLPAAATGNKGYTYKVIDAGTYQGIACKKGDVVVSDGTSWTLIPSGDEPSGTVTSVGLSVPTGFSVSGSPVTSSGTLSLSFASGYSLPTTAKQTEWDNKANSSDIKVTNATVSNTGSGNAVTSVSISSGQIVATKGTTFLTSHQSLSNCAKLNSSNSFTASNYFYSGSKAAFYQGSTVLNSAANALLGYDSLIFYESSLWTSYKTGKIVVEDSSNQYELTLPKKSGEIALKSDISSAVMYEHNVSVYFDGNLSTTGGTFRNVIYMQFKFVDTQATIPSWSALVSRMLSVWPDNTSVRFPCNGWLIYNNNSFNCIINNMAREGDHIFINARAANGTTGEIYAYFYGNETVNYYDSVTTLAVPAVMTNYAPTTVWSGSVTQSGGSRTLSSLSGASTLDDGIWRITVTYQGATIGITLLIADGKGYGYGGESSMGSYNVYMVGLQYESGTFWARGTTFKGSSNNYGSGSVSDVAFQATITYKKIERLVSF